MRKNDLRFADEQLDAVVVETELLRRRVNELGAQIRTDYEGRPIHLVSVLRGSMMIVADLMRSIEGNVTIDFIAVSSYGPQFRDRGVVRLIKDLDEPIENRHVLVVEDVIDTGLTLNYILRILKARQPASLAVATLVDKPAHRLIELPLRYVGFTVPDIFVVGYGLDYFERYRNLPFLATLKLHAAAR